MKLNCASHCFLKRSFNTEKQALEEMKWLKVSKEYSKLKRAYKCTLCDKWHLTKMTEYANNKPRKLKKRRK